MEFCDQSWNPPILLLNVTIFCAFFAHIRKFGISLESLHFLTFSAKCHECKICAERWSWKIEKRSWKIEKNILQSLWEPCNYKLTERVEKKQNYFMDGPRPRPRAMRCGAYYYVGMWGIQPGSDNLWLVKCSISDRTETY